MHWLAAYLVITLVALGLLLRYAWHRPIPPKCFYCVNYSECDRTGECEYTFVRAKRTAPRRGKADSKNKISAIK